MRTGRDRIKETFWDFYIESGQPSTNAFSLLDEYADRIMKDINQAIITKEDA